MVGWLGDTTELLNGVLLAQEKAQTLLTRLDPQRRAKVLAALAGLVILGFGLVALVWLGGRFTRRYMNPQTGSGRDPDQDEDDWADKPIVTKEKPSRSQEPEEP